MDRQLPVKGIAIGVIVAIVAIVIGVLLLFGGDNNNTDPNNSDNGGDGNTAIDVPDAVDSMNGRTGIYSINTESMVNALNSISLIRDNFNKEIEESRYLSYSDDGYTLSKIYSVVCKPKDVQNVVGQDFMLQTTIEFKGNNLYPSSVTVTYDYTSDKDNNTGLEWAYKLVSSIVNSETGKHMENCSFGKQPVRAYDVNEDLYVTVAKMNDDYTDTIGCKVASYAVEIKQNNIEGYYAELNDFKSEDNPQFGLFKAGILEYGADMETSTQRIADLFGEGLEAKPTIISDYINKTEDNKVKASQSTGDWVVYKDKSEVARFSANINESGEEPYIKIVFNGQQFDNVVDAFYNAEDILKVLTGNTVELQDYVKETEFTSTIKQSGLRESYGYPLKLTGKQNKVGDKVYLSISLETTE